MLENIRLSFIGIWSHKMRSLLTMLGIIIGIAAIIAIVSTIKGTNDQIKNQIIGSGNNAVVVQLYEGSAAIDPQYSSDRYVHLTYPAYQIWTDKVTAAVSHQLELEQKAAAAVLGYEKGRSRDALNAAEKALAALEPSALKDSLTARLEKAASA